MIITLFYDIVINQFIDQPPLSLSKALTQRISTTGRDKETVVELERLCLKSLYCLFTGVVSVKCFLICLNVHCTVVYMPWTVLSQSIKGNLEGIQCIHFTHPNKMLYSKYSALLSK